MLPIFCFSSNEGDDIEVSSVVGGWCVLIPQVPWKWYAFGHIEDANSREMYITKVTPSVARDSLAFLPIGGSWTLNRSALIV